CAVCLGHNSHCTVECTTPRTWDNLFGTFYECINKALWTKDGQQLCTSWQHEEGCTNNHHSSKHVCSGCGASDHGAQRCTRAQK
ncbi:uncharacterized protein EDB91DRAFT_1030953, partial [Suillus paluster]|uniref:uncharacterized protein n=1 Tax=Suillus paluster TaxID=48578 RepID=UPI001B86C841